uniref:Uncharacterized protein n=1 Tax=Arundo donax TaxID=35708 RepID=A0A0A9CEZ2_ARUDO
MTKLVIKYLSNQSV